jgi:hypothetical protein
MNQDIGSSSRMKELILAKLQNMEDLEQRRLLKEIMAGFFINLVDYQDTCNRNLEERVFREAATTADPFDIAVSLCPRRQVDPLDNLLFPVFPEELAERSLDLQELIETFRRREEVKLATAFMKCDYPTIQKLTELKRSFPGRLVTSGGNYPIRVKLQPEEGYRREVAKLYELFLKNGISWKTVNHPFTNKFFRVILSDLDAEPALNEQLLEIVFDLEEYETCKILDAVLLWNVERLKIAGNGFPVPALDRVNYEHPISIRKTGVEHGYLLDEAPGLIKYLIRTGEEIVVVSPAEKCDPWNLVKIAQPAEGKAITGNEIYSNRRHRSFLAEFPAKQATPIRTRGEIARIANSFEMSANFELRAVEIVAHPGIKRVTYDLNSFIVDDIRVANDRKIMKLKFSLKKQEQYVTYDLLSFIVSEIQMNFPEYCCVGELV